MIGGLQPNVQYQRVDGGQTDMALGQISAPLNNVLTVLNAAFGGSLGNPTLNSQSLSPLSRIPFADKSSLFVANGYLNYQNAAGNVIRLGAAGAASSPTGPISLSQIPAGSSGQVLTTVGSTVSWQTPSGGGTVYSVFGASGGSHSSGLVPDPGSTAGTTRYLREDATWVTVPPGATGPAGPTGPTGATGATGATGPAGTSYSVFGASGASHSSGIVPDPGATAGTAKYLREDATWATPPSGTTYSTFGASGTSHSGGLVPDPGSVTGTVKYLREDATWVTPPNNTYSAFVASGGSHATGLVPDPGATSGTTKYLREDATWVVPPDHTYTTFGASGGSHASGLVPDPGATAGTTKYLREDGSWVVPSGGASGLQAGMEGVLFTATQTWSASGVSNSVTTTSTYNGNTVTRYVITKVAITLVSGTPGTTATFGAFIGSFTCFSSRQLPTYAGGVDVTIVDINVQNINGTSKNAQPGDVLKVTSGGSFSTSCSWRIDWIGYYY